MQLSDERLLGCLGTETDALAEFYRRHVDRILTFVVYRVRSPEDAADLTQSVFLAVIDGADRFDPRRGSAIGWLYGVAGNTVASWRRQQARGVDAARRAGGRRLLDDDEYERLVERLSAVHVASRVRTAMATMPTGQRELLEGRLRDAGVDVRVSTVLASTSAVGSVASFSTEAGDQSTRPPPGIQYHDDAFFGLTIDPLVFTGTFGLSIAVDAAGADYQLAEEVFEPGEPFGGLHCLLGEPLLSADLAPYAQQTGVRISWVVLTPVRDEVNGGWAMTSEAVEEIPDGQVMWGYARNADVVQIEVISHDEGVPEGWAPRLSDVPCTADQAVRWRG